MPFTQVDDTTVQDEQGNKYFAPYLTPPSGPVQEPQETGPNPADITSALAQLGQRTTLPSSGPENPYPPANAPDYQIPPALPKPPEAVQREQARQAAQTQDVTGFSASGGTARSDEDLARMAGGHAIHEAETAKAKAVSEQTNVQLAAERDRKMADLVMGTAKEYDDHVQKIMDDSKARWTDWKKRNDAAAAQLVDPAHAFNGPVMSKINWALYFLGAGMTGGASVNAAMDTMHKIIDQDIAAQKTNIQNKREGLESEKTMLTEQDKLGKDAVADWYFAKNLRMQAVGKTLDSQIAQMGLPAAQAAGLLAARDAIEKEVIKTQEHVSDHYFEQGKEKAKFAHEAYMARLQSSLRKEEDVFKAGLKAGERGDTLPTGTPLGLQMINKQTGQPLLNGKIPLKVKGDKAVEAGKLFDQANEEASQLNEVKADLQKMSTSDLIRGGTPEFKAKIKDLIQTRAVRDNGHRLSDADVDRAAQEEFGVKMSDSVVGNTIDAMRAVGAYKDGVLRTVDDQLRNLGTKTINRLQPYIDSDVAQQFDIQFNPQQTHVGKGGETPDDLNTAITKAAGGADVSDLRVTGPRSPVSKDVTIPGVPQIETQVYNAEKAKGRGVQGGLPRLSTAEEAKVDQASAAFQNATADDVIRLAKAYLRDKSLSEEAKHEIRIESLDALKHATEIEDMVREKAMDEYTSGVGQGEGAAYVNPQDLVRDSKGNYTKDFEKYLQSDVVNEMRRRAGLEPRVR